MRPLPSSGNLLGKDSPQFRVGSWPVQPAREGSSVPALLHLAWTPDRTRPPPFPISLLEHRPYDPEGQVTADYLEENLKRLLQ